MVSHAPASAAAAFAASTAALNAMWCAERGRSDAPVGAMRSAAKRVPCSWLFMVPRCSRFLELLELIDLALKGFIDVLSLF